jgi:hypothetical protein
LPRAEPLALGKTETHVVLRVGPWTLSFEIASDARFPDVERALPDAGSAATHLQLDPEDARFLGPALVRLPGADERNAPATLELNGRVAIRARAADQPRTTELVLSRSRYTGPPVRLNLNRDFLARALGLGLAEVAIVDGESPIVGRDAHLCYAWQPLSKESALEPADDVTRIESAPMTPEPARRPVEATDPRTTMNEQRPEAGPDTVPPVPNGTASDHGSAGSGLAALIQEAVTLHEALGEARTRTQRLIAALRRLRKQARLMSGALEALQQLKLQEVRSTPMPGLTVTEKSFWKERIAARITQRIEAIQAAHPALFERVKRQAHTYALELLGLADAYAELERVQAEEAALGRHKKHSQRALLAALRGIPIEEVPDSFSVRYGGELPLPVEAVEALTRRQAAHQEQLLGDDPIGREFARLEAERNRLLDVIWLATSPAQIKQLWSKITALLDEEPTPLEREALAITPSEEA